MNVGDIVTVRGRAYRVVGFREDGEPRLVLVHALEAGLAAFAAVLLGVV